MRIWAIYRSLYGEDWVGHSIRSIRDHVERIFFFPSTEPWGGIKSVFYKGVKIHIPNRIDNVVEVAKEAYEDLEVIGYNCPSPVSQFTNLVNHFVLERQRPDYIMVIENDQVFRKDQIELAISELPRERAVGGTNYCCKTFQDEIWKPPQSVGWHVVAPQRANRTGVVFWRVEGPSWKMPPTRHQAEPVKGIFPHMSATVHNLGFAVSEATMFWKHVVGIGISAGISDSKPDPNWYTARWLGWVQGMKDLEISENHKSAIREVEPYDPALLPEEILR